MGLPLRGNLPNLTLATARIIDPLRFLNHGPKMETPSIEARGDPTRCRHGEYDTLRGNWR